MEKRVDTSAALRVVLVVLAVAGVLWLIYALRSVILLLLLSIFFAYLISPVVALFERPFQLRGRPRRLSRPLAVGVVYLLLFGLLAIVLAWLGPRVSEQSSQLAAQVPAYAKSFQAQGAAVGNIYNRLGLPPEARQAVDSIVNTLISGITEVGRRFAMGVIGLLSYLPWLVLIPILAFLLLKDADAFREAAVCVMPGGRPRAQAAELLDRIDVALSAYVRAQLLACLLVGLVVLIGFVLLGVPYGVMLGAAAGVAEFVPLVGPLVIAVVAALLAGLHEPMLALWTLIFLGVVRVVEDYVVYPRLVGHGIDLHPLVVIVAVLAGAELAGVAGVFLAVPAAAILSAAYDQYLASRRNGGLVDTLRPTGTRDRPPDRPAGGR